MSTANATVEVNQIFQKLLQAGIISGGEVSIPVVRDPQMEQCYATAVKNREFYQKQAAKTGNPWHQHTRYPYQYSEFIETTPEMAEVALRHNVNNRRIKRSSLDAYRRDIEARRWVQTDESIGFDVNGDLYNGQHRLTAVYDSKVPAVFYYTFNVPVQARFVVDSGAKRSITDKLKLIMENPLGTKLGGISRAMMRGISMPIRFSDAEIAEFASKYGDTIEWSAKSCPQMRCDVLAAVAKASLWYDQSSLQSFCQRLSEKLFSSVNDPAKRLYEYIIKSQRATGVTIYKKTLSAIEHEINGREPRALYERDKDVFEWVLPGWNLPDKN